MKQRGFVYADALVGLFLIAVVGGSLVTVQAGFQKFARAMGNQRAAVRHAEQAIAALQAGETPAADLQTTVVRLPDAAPTGWQWVRIDAREANGRAQLVGLAKAAQ